MDNEIWKTRDGQQVVIKDLTTQHLLNIIRFFKTRSDKRNEIIDDSLAALSYACSTSADGASMAAEAAANEGFAMADKLPVLPKQWPVLIAEAKVRGLFHELEELKVA